MTREKQLKNDTAYNGATVNFLLSIKNVTRSKYGTNQANKKTTHPINIQCLDKPYNFKHHWQTDWYDGVIQNETGDKIQ